MIKRMFLIMSVGNVSGMLHGMMLKHKKVEELKPKKSSSHQSSQELSYSSEDNDQLSQHNLDVAVSPSKKGGLSKGGKSSVKSLNDLKDVRRAQSEFREKIYDKNGSMSEKK